MNEKKQAIILLSVVLLTLAGLFLYRIQHLESRITNLMIENHAQKLHSTMQTLQKYSYAKYRDRISNLLNSAPQIVEEFLQQDRKQLYNYTKVRYESLKRENRHFHLMQFHLPDGTVFLRMHQPDLFGDRLEANRTLLSTVHQRQTCLSGFEFSREGLFYRVIHPIFDGKRYAGAVEIGIRAQEVVEALEENLDEQVISYFAEPQWKKATQLADQQVTKVGQFVVKPENASLVNLLPPEFYEKEHDYFVKQEGQNFRVHNHQLFKDFENKSIGGIIVFQDISAVMQRKQSFFWKAALATLLLFLMAATVFYTSFERILDSLVKEIAVRKQTEIEVQDKKDEIRLLLDSTAEGIFGLNPEGKCTFVNRSCLDLLGYKHEDQLLGATLHDLIHNRRPDGTDFPKAECPMCQSYHNGQRVDIDNEVLWSRDGQAIPVEYHAYPIKKNGYLIGSVVSFSDISRRKQAEEDKNRLAAAIEHAADEIIITNLDGVIEYVNPAFEGVTGYTRDEIVGNTPSVLKSGKHSKEFYQDLWETICAGKIWSNRIINKTKSGALIEEDATISPIFDPAGRSIGYVAVKRDITEKVKLEKRLRHASKMESLGTLAGAIAHDFNNILNGIIGFTSMSLHEVSENSPVADKLKGVLGAAETATDLVQQILAFSRKKNSSFKPVLVQDVIKDIIKLLRCTMPKSITIEEQIDLECGPIWANASQIHQIIMNLGTNAYHAMGRKGGVLSIHLEKKTIKQQKNGKDADRFVQLQIIDTGCGIAPDNLANIFKPYFTTKKEGEGTGLGLATVHEIVQSHNGDIDVCSEPGKGTTFTLLFPVYRQDVTASKKEEQSSPLPYVGAGHVLFVDDVAFNVILGQEILQSAGCKVTGLSDSAKALEFFRAQPDKIDLVVTDHIMPGLTGTELAREMIRVRPDIPIIMVAGDELPSDEAEFCQSGIRAFLNKPINPKKLLEATADAISPVVS
ncbi:MAG: PAS domain S-box protein [Desulfobulbaceae bacterium]|nr:PAS domain S-box protein [Desulfobulbaceae bacterium]